MAYPPPTLPTNRTNATPQLDTHAADHNALALAVNDIVGYVGSRFLLVAGGQTQRAPTAALNGETSCLTNPLTVPYQSRIFVTAHGYAGCDASALDGATISILNDQAQNASTPTIGSAPANRYAHVSLSTSWVVPASSSPRLWLTLSWVGTGGGTTFAAAYLTWQQYKIS